MVTAIRADNPGPLTLTGTQTYVIGPGPLIVLDPGPRAETHLERVNEVIGGRPVAAVCLTHAHGDHSASAADAVERWGALRASSATLDRVGIAGRALADDETLVLEEGVCLRALATPGHAADHLCYLLELDDGPGTAVGDVGREPTRMLFTGDLVLGEGSTMIAYPDGSVRAYLESLARLADLRPDRLLPGHGPSVGPPGAAVNARLDECRAHRLRRVASVRRALEAGARTPEAIRAAVYGDIPVSYHAAAELTIRAYLACLGRTSSSMSRRR